MFTHGISGIYIHPINVSAPDPSPISRYSECTKMNSFSLLGFDFLGVVPNQKNRYWSLNFDFEDERNPMLGSLKNSSSVKSPNFPQ